MNRKIAKLTTISLFFSYKIMNIIGYSFYV